MKQFKYGQLVLGLVSGIILTTATGANAAVGDKVEAIFAEFNFVINGKTTTLDQTPIVINGDSYLPVRSISNALGYDVTYKSDSRTIQLDNSTVAPSNSPTSTPVTNVEVGKVYYSLKEVGADQIKKGNVFASGIKYINGKSRPILTYKELDYIVNQDFDYYYDMNTDYIYYSKSFLEVFLPKNDLAAYNTYTIDYKNKVVTPIK